MKGKLAKQIFPEGQKDCKEKKLLLTEECKQEDLEKHAQAIKDFVFAGYDKDLTGEEELAEQKKTYAQRIENFYVTIYNRYYLLSQDCNPDSKINQFGPT